MLIDIGDILATMIFSIISTLIIVPIVFIINKKMEFDSYLHLLNEEIKWNMDKIERFPENLNKVRESYFENSIETWLPAKATNKSEIGYIYQYLSLNVYNNLIDQPFFNYIGDGSIGRITELFYWFSIYNRIIHVLQCNIHHNTRLYENYNENFFSQSEVIINGITFNLSNVTRNIRDNYPHIESRFGDINLYKKELWWCPESIKNMLDND